ncbi:MULTISPECIES: hypothetical protein [unclassified Acidovorax]|uniref:hypothetical protein n=1 Tax=unclassified Acidovorax TaxID=2684926 RepID=UPI00145F9FCC|nr:MULTISPECIES: hypothetical protein [unclassified Acidovorax]
MSTDRLPTAPHARRPAWRGWGLGVLALAASLAVFALYSEPGFMVMLADQMWACF